MSERSGGGSGDRPDLLTRLGGLLSALAGGMGINVVSGTGLPGLAVVSAVTAGVVSAVELRRRQGSGLARGSAPVLLGLALVAVVVAVLPALARWAGPATIAAGVLVLTASLSITDAERLLATLGGAADVALGVTVFGVGVGVLVDHHPLLGAALVAAGVAGVSGGVGVLFYHRTLLSVAVVILVAALVCGGVGVLLDHRTLLGAAVVAVGVVFVGVGVGVLLDHPGLLCAASVAAGVVFVGAGVGVLLDHPSLLGAALVAVGVAVGGLGLLVLQRLGPLGRLVSKLVRLAEDPEMSVPGPDHGRG